MSACGEKSNFYFQNSAEMTPAPIERAAAAIVAAPVRIH